MPDRPMIKNGEKTILISKQAFADVMVMSCSEVTKKFGVQGVMFIPVLSKLGAIVMYELFDNEEDEDDE